MNYQGHSLIFIASLVPNKKGILEQIRRSHSKAWVAIRTVEGLIDFYINQ
ncbi:hypothetical protein [Thermoflavimicrobium daqui]|nr:hypothetical protein [Thermoflavimicrobium daqui]